MNNNPEQTRAWNANHEAAHAAATILGGDRVTELKINWQQGYCKSPPGPRKWGLREAANWRIGALYAGDDWNDPCVRIDRGQVEMMCPVELAFIEGGEELWQEMVLDEAGKIMATPEFQALAAALSRELRARWELDEAQINKIVEEVRTNAA